MNLKLNIKKTIFVGFAFFLISMFWQVYDTVIAKILIDSFGLNQTWSGVVMALDNIIAVILLPIFGKLSDEQKNQLIQEEKKLGNIPKDSKVQDYIPEIIKKDFSKKIDWNYNTIVSTAQKFDILRPKHPELNLEKFWQAILRGGIQAAVYFSDSIKS